MGCFQSKSVEKAPSGGPPQLPPIGPADVAQKLSDMVANAQDNNISKNSDTTTNTTSINQEDNLDQLIGSRYGSKVATMPDELRNEFTLSGIETGGAKKSNAFILGEKASIVGGTSNIASDPELNLSKIGSVLSSDSHRSYRASTIPSGIVSADSQLSLRPSNMSAILSGLSSSSSIQGNRIKSDNFGSSISCKFLSISTFII